MRYLFILALFFQFFATSAFAQNYKYHIVQEGETVTSIAREYNISLETLYTYNPDAKAGINVNSKLVVPVKVQTQQPEMEFREHKVRRKETLFSLSQQYQVSIDNIKKFNPHLYSEELRRGETIRIPVSLPATHVEEEEKTSNENPLGLSIKEHVVLPKETKYAISRKYNLSIEELERLNPGVDTLRPGMVLRIRNGKPAVPTAGNERLFKFYLVKPQETLYSLTTRLGISRDSLEVLNPALKEGLKAGMVLKIPNPEATPSFGNYSEEQRIQLTDRIINYETKDLVVMLPFSLDKIISTDSTSNASQTIREESRLKISLDFYSGFLMAVDSAKALGLSTNIKVFDTKSSPYEVNNLINTNDFNGVDAVIGPLLNSTVEAAVRRLEGRDIPVISPLTKKAPNNVRNHVQTRPTDEMLEETMLSYISQNASGKNIIVIADADKGNIKRRLMTAFPGSRTVNPVNGSTVSKEALSSALVSGKPNWVILESDDISVISDVASYLYSRSKNQDITLLTLNMNDSFESDNVSSLHLATLNLTYPSVDKEFNAIQENTFISTYLKKYGYVPNTYAVRGFDVTFDILLRMASAEDLPSSLDEEGTTEYVENKFDYEKSSTGSYFNKAIYILRIGEDMKINVVNQ